MYPVKILIRLHECAGWSESLLGTHVQRKVFCRGSFHLNYIRNGSLSVLCQQQRSALASTSMQLDFSLLKLGYPFYLKYHIPSNYRTYSHKGTQSDHSVVFRLKSVRRPRWLGWMRRPTGDQEVAGSTPAEVGNILSWRLIMKYFLRSFSSFGWFKKGSCQFLAKEYAQYWLTA